MSKESKQQALFGLNKINIENVLNGLQHNIYCLDRNNMVIWCNETQAKAFKLPSASVCIGKHLSEIGKMIGSPDETFADLIKNNEAIMKSGQSVVFEESVYVENNRKTFLSHKNPLYDNDGNIVGILGVGIDVTEKKENERLLSEKEEIEKSLESMSLLAASMAHELRTPLVAIQQGAIGISRYLKPLYENHKKAVEAKLDVQPIRGSKLKSLEHVLDNLALQAKQALMFIDMSMANLKEYKIIEESFTTVGMFESIDKVLSTYPLQPGEAELLHWDPEQNQDFQYRGDINLTEHIFYNLIKNALYFIQAEQKGNITIESKVMKKENRIIFTDTARGIPEDMLHDIFIPLYSKRDFGTGIGLPYCRMIMQAYGGDIDCKSVYGKYARFILRFPKL